jgi:hypothetical protein
MCHCRPPREEKMKRYRITYKNTNIEAPEGEFLIGRGNDCHLVLDDPSVSRIHAVIEKKGADLFIEDKGSRNGVIVNKKRIPERTLLQEGDQVVIGHQVIRIAVMKEASSPERTQGIIRCPSCGGWSSGDANTCSACGRPFTVTPDSPTKALKAATAVSGRPSFSTLCELASKSIQVGKVDEAERLMETVFSAVKSRIADNEPISPQEFEQISEVMLALAKADKNPNRISQIFTIHHMAKRLMSRDLVEMLYNSVRPTGYLACPEMTRYLSFLDAQSERLSPGELFVYRRLTGLVKLCS